MRLERMSNASTYQGIHRPRGGRRCRAARGRVLPWPSRPRQHWRGRSMACQLSAAGALPPLFHRDGARRAGVLVAAYLSAGRRVRARRGVRASARQARVQDRLLGRRVAASFHARLSVLHAVLLLKGDDNEEPSQCRAHGGARLRLLGGPGRGEDRYAVAAEHGGGRDLRRQQNDARSVDEGDRERRLSVDAEAMNTPILESVLTCPKCGFAKAESMPTDACQFHYECTRCGALLRPNPGDCCVFCSFGSVKCPPMQAKRR